MPHIPYSHHFVNTNLTIASPLLGAVGVIPLHIGALLERFPSYDPSIEKGRQPF